LIEKRVLPRSRLLGEDIGDSGGEKTNKSFRSNREAGEHYPASQHRQHRRIVKEAYEKIAGKEAVEKGGIVATTRV